MGEFGHIFPTRYQMRVFYQASQGEIYADWLVVMNQALYEEMRHYDWTARMYPSSIPLENVRFSR